MNRKDYYARRRAEAKAAGICVSCLKRPATHGQKCEHCRMIQQPPRQKQARKGRRLPLLQRALRIW